MNKHYRAIKGGKAADHTSPLRRIVDYDGDFEILECGHRQMVKSDIAGYYYAERRRCKKCAKGLAALQPHQRDEEMK